jgi:hypothetical protein
MRLILSFATVAAFLLPLAMAQGTGMITNPDGSVQLSPTAAVPNVAGGIVASPPAVAVLNHLSAGSLIFLQPNSQTYFVEGRQGIFTWQPVDPTIALNTLAPYLVIECYPEVPATVGGPFGFTALVRSDSGQYSQNIPVGWAGSNWNVALREQGGSVIVAGQKFAIMKQGTPLAPTTNLAGNTRFNPGTPGGWPTNAAEKVSMGSTMVMTGLAAVFMALALI